MPKFEKYLLYGIFSSSILMQYVLCYMEEFLAYRQYLCFISFLTHVLIGRMKNENITSGVIFFECVCFT